MWVGDGVHQIPEIEALSQCCYTHHHSMEYETVSSVVVRHERLVAEAEADGGRANSENEEDVNYK